MTTTKPIETVVMYIPVGIAEQVKLLVDGYNVRMGVQSELRDRLVRLSALNGVDREIAVYSLTEKELLSLTNLAYELSGTSDRFIKSILTRFHGQKLRMSDDQRATTKEHLTRFLSNPALITVLRENR